MPLRDLTEAAATAEAEDLADEGSDDIGPAPDTIVGSDDVPVVRIGQCANCERTDMKVVDDGEAYICFDEEDCHAYRELNETDEEHTIGVKDKEAQELASLILFAAEKGIPYSDCEVSYPAPKGAVEAATEKLKARPARSTRRTAQAQGGCSVSRGGVCESGAIAGREGAREQAALLLVRTCAVRQWLGVVASAPLQGRLLADDESVQQAVPSGRGNVMRIVSVHAGEMPRAVPW